MLYGIEGIEDLTGASESSLTNIDPIRVPAPRTATRAPLPNGRPVPAGWRLGLTLAICFVVSIAMMLGVGYWSSNRVLTIDHAADLAVDARLTKLQLLHEAIQLSNANNAISIKLFLNTSSLSATEVLATRDENSHRVTAIIDQLEARCDSSDERRLLQAVVEARAPYLKSYHYALKLLLESNDKPAADAVMLQQVFPQLYSYRIAWDTMASFEMEQIKTTNDQGEVSHVKTRRIALLVVWLAAAFALVIGIFATARIVVDARARGRMQQELRDLNAELEQRVVDRTEELASAQLKLHDSLEETQAYTREVEAINELVKALQSCLNLQEAQRLSSRVLAQFFASGSLLLLNSSRNLLDVAFTWGGGDAKAGPFAPDSCWALRKGERHLVQRSSFNLLCGHVGDELATCHLCLPMIALGESLGVLSIDDSSLCCIANLRAGPRKLRLAETLAEQIALAFANLQLRETLKFQSSRDPLTGLFNRRHMEEALERELQRAVRHDSSVTVLMIDIDHFKRFNDVFGHEAGDLLLRELGASLRSQVRGADMACRYGGEEFLLIMAESTLEAGCQRGEAIRRQVSALQVRYRGEMLHRITVSIGVAEYPAHGDSAAAVVKAADEALYRAKREGRDRVVCAGG